MPDASVSCARPIVIVHVITNLHAASGGPTTAVVELAREQAGTGEAVRVIVDESPSDAAPILARWSGRDVAIAGAMGLMLGARQSRSQLVYGLRDLRPRIVHLHGVWDPILRRAASACNELGLPWVVSSHGMLHPFTLGQGALKKRVYLRLFPRLLGRARTIFTLNAEEADCVRRRFGVPAIVAPTGINPAPYERTPDGVFARSVPGLDGTPFILFLGRLDEIKGVDLLLASYAEAVAAGMRADLVLAGPDFGAERALRALTHRLGLAERVHFVGPLSGDRKHAALAECALFAHRPRYEGFGIAVVEAMAAGRPVVTTAACRLDGAAEAGAIRLADDQTGAFAKAIITLADDGEVARALGSRARAWVRRELAWPAILGRAELGYRA
jgi:glycosyltransferase involved in cell wall biosynthesis